MQALVKESAKVISFTDRTTEMAVRDYALPFGAEYLRYKLGWSLGFADKAIAEYKRFVVMALISDREITPSQTVDEVWHLHILHTKDYAKFAERIGHFLHHNPGGADEAPRFSRQYEDTLQYYRDTFKQEPPAEFWPRQTVREDIDLKAASFPQRSVPQQKIETGWFPNALSNLRANLLKFWRTA